MVIELNNKRTIGFTLGEQNETNKITTLSEEQIDKLGKITNYTENIIGYNWLQLNKF